MTGEAAGAKRNADAAPATDDSVAVGIQIKAFRKERGWSLNQLASASNVSMGLLSQIERGRSIPSLRTLTKLRLALDVSLGDLVGQRDAGNPNEAQFVKRLKDRETLVIGDDQLVKEFLSPVKSDRLQVMLLRIPAGGGAGAGAYSYEGEKAGLVLTGNFKLQLGEDVFDLKEGDSFQFDSSIPHTFINTSKAEAKVIWIICKIPHNGHL